MDQLFRQMALSQCRQNASTRTRSSQLNVSDGAAHNLTCEEAANEMLEWRYAPTERLRFWALQFVKVGDVGEFLTFEHLKKSLKLGIRAAPHHLPPTP